MPSGCTSLSGVIHWKYIMLPKIPTLVTQTVSPPPPECGQELSSAHGPVTSQDLDPADNQAFSRPISWWTLNIQTVVRSHNKLEEFVKDLEFPTETLERPCLGIKHFSRDVRTHSKSRGE